MTILRPTRLYKHGSLSCFTTDIGRMIYIYSYVGIYYVYNGCGDVVNEDLCIEFNVYL
jgi:hypothetical protein